MVSLVAGARPTAGIIRQRTSGGKMGKGVIAAQRRARHDRIMSADPDRWPELPYAAWADTAATLQLWTQIVGKIRLARTPWLNHSWHVALYVTARGLTTSPIPDGARTFQIDFDFIDHVLWMQDQRRPFPPGGAEADERWRNSTPT